MMKEQAAKQIGKLIPIEIPTSTNVDKAAILNTSLRKVDHSAKITRQFHKLAMWVAHEIRLKTNIADELGLEQA